jgi:hypothetical protein
MPNVAWQEPQILVDLLAVNLLADENEMAIPEPHRVSIVSAWFSEVELFLRPGPWHRHLQIERSAGTYSLNRILQRFLGRGWMVEVAVLAYGRNPSGLTKKPDEHRRERYVLRNLLSAGASVYLVPDLHAKGVITPLGLVTGSTNLTRSGLFLQAQNANYFPFDSADYHPNVTQLRSRFESLAPATAIP